MFQFDIFGLTDEALERELVYRHQPPIGNNVGTFYLDANDFSAVTPRDPEKVLELILLIREKYAEYKDHGPHTGLLCLFAQREELAQNHTRWCRSHHINRKVGVWVKLADWLSEQGHPYQYEFN